MSSTKSKSARDKKKPPKSNKPPKAAIARIKAQVEARKKAEAEEQLKQKEWEEEQERLDREDNLREERLKEEKERRKQEREIRKKENEERNKQRILEERLSKYGYSIGSTVIKSETKPKPKPETNPESEPKMDQVIPKIHEGWDDLEEEWEDPLVDLHNSDDHNSDNNNNNNIPNDLRSPIVCVLGHVDVGKTKLLDYLRKTHVQDNEAGGITQQIGTSFFPISEVQKTINRPGLANKIIEYGIPGLLVIDTPGHESFVNLRSRGTGICDFAILVVDLMGGLEQQTIESINLLKMRQTPFVIVLNKLDLIYDWKSEPDGSCARNFKKQSKHVQQTFDTLANHILVEMAEQGLNAMLYWKNRDPRGTISMVPTSAHTGEGIPDLLSVITQMVQRYLSKEVTHTDRIEATVLEVKPVQGLGTTIDIILINGTLRIGDQIFICGINGPIVTQIRDILTTQPMKELRIKSPYIHHESIRAAQGIKLLANDLDQAIAGSSVYLGNTYEDKVEAFEMIEREFREMENKIETQGEGVYVQASTLGGLEALLHFLKDSEVPVVGFGIGPVTKKDIIKASIMYKKGKEKYSVVLAFDVSISEEVRLEATQSHVQIFEADIIYHLLDSFTEHLRVTEEANREAAAKDAVTPCVLEIIQRYIFNARNPIIIGVTVLEGELRVGTPLVVRSKDNKDNKDNKEMLELGTVTKIERNQKPVDSAQVNEEVSISIVGDNNYCYGRQFDHTKKLYSKLTRRSIDALKEFFRDTLTQDRVRLIIRIKKKLGLV